MKSVPDIAKILLKLALNTNQSMLVSIIREQATQTKQFIELKYSMKVDLSEIFFYDIAILSITRKLRMRFMA